MGLLDIANMLRSYAGANASAPPPNTQQDFENVAQHAPAEHMSSGLAAAFQSNQTPPFAQMIGQLFANSDGQQRAGILNQLIAAAGPAVASGALSHLLPGGSTTVTPQQAEQISPEAAQQIAEHAHQQNPGVVQQASDFYAQHPKVVQALGAGALALVMSHLSQKT